MAFAGHTKATTEPTTSLPHTKVSPTGVTVPKSTQSSRHRVQARDTNCLRKRKIISILTKQRNHTNTMHEPVPSAGDSIAPAPRESRERVYMAKNTAAVNKGLTDGRDC